MKYPALILLTALLALLSGCVSTPERPAQQLILPMLEAPKELQIKRVNAFRKLTSKV